MSDAQGQPTTQVDEQTLARVLGSAAGLDQSRGDAIEVAVVPANATDSGQLITDPATPADQTAAASASSIPPAAAAGAGAFVMLLIAVAFRRRRAKREQALVGAPAGRRRKGKGAPEGAEPTELLPPVRPGSPLDPEREAVEEIRGDLERMLAESPESLAALLSNWMSK